MDHHYYSFLSHRSTSFGSWDLWQCIAWSNLLPAEPWDWHLANCGRDCCGWTEAAPKLPGRWVRGSNSQRTSCRQRPKLPLTGIWNRGLYRMDGNRLACLWFMFLHRYPSKCAWVKLYSNCYLHVLQKWITEELWLWRQVLGWILALHAATQSSNWLMLTPSEASWRRWQRGLISEWIL